MAFAGGDLARRMNTTHITNAFQSTADPETADIVSSSDDYARRFEGAAGAWMLKVQERLTLELLSTLERGATVLDIGGGHAQLAPPLCTAGFSVTVHGSDPVCENRLRPWTGDGRVRFTSGNLLDPPFPPGSFDAAIAFRLLTHCCRWEGLVETLCRMARRLVIVDFPTTRSLNCIAPMLFETKRHMERNTRPWHSFRPGEVAEAFARHGFASTGERKQFFLPIVLHRMLRCRPLSAGAEAAARALGLTRFAGSPVIARFDKHSEPPPART
jgi:2-polyprenyl-3-methyl-5-hydroxy-6-metoxy-1,4-benzoquinol methylase